MKIVIIGAGAVGSVIAAYLSNFNYNIQLVCKHREILESIENHGLRINGIKEPIICYPKTVIDLSQIADKPDIIFLATKANKIQELVQNIVPFLKNDTVVVSLQNGICEEYIAEIVGPNRTVGCVVGWCATMTGPGRVELTSNGEFIIGELDGDVTHRLLIIKSMLEKIFKAKITSNIYGALFSKLIIDSCINTLGAISGLPLGELLNLNIARSIFLHIITEGVQVAKINQVKLEKIDKKIDLYKFALRPKEYTNDFSLSLLLKHFMIQIIGIKYRRIKSSSLLLLDRGKPTDVDYLNGYIIKKARQYKIPVPVNQKLVNIVKQIETGKMKIDRENLFQIL